MTTTFLLATAFITATLISAPAVASSDRGQFDADANYQTVQTVENLSRIKDSLSSETRISHKATVAQKQRLSDLIASRDSAAPANATAKMTKPRAPLQSKPSLNEIQ